MEYFIVIYPKTEKKSKYQRTFNMKYFVLVLILIIAGCKDEYGLTKKERKSIELDIELHNISEPFKWAKKHYERSNAIKREFREAVILGQLKFKDIENTEEFKRRMDAYTDSLTHPYNVENDTALTLRNYMNYCSAYKLDPKTYLEILNK